MDRRTTVAWLDSLVDRSILVRRLAAPAFVTALVLALATSGGILQERVSEGSVRVGLLVNIALTLLAVLALVITVRPIVLALASRKATTGGSPALATAVVGSQVLGAALGIVLVHAAIRHGWGGAASWLCERPAQLVNDSVAVVAILAVVWACARGLDVRVLAAALIVVSTYLATAGRWHLDHAPHGFDATVQQFVAAQFVAAAFALAVFHALMTHGEQ